MPANGESGTQLSSAAHAKGKVCNFTCDTPIEMDYHWICSHCIGPAGAGYHGWKRACYMGSADPAPLHFKQRKEIGAFHLRTHASASAAKDHGGHPPPGRGASLKARREHKHLGREGADADGAGVGDSAGSVASMEKSLLLTASHLLLAVVAELRGTGM